MTALNIYCTRLELLHEIMTGEDSAAVDSVDDPVVDDIITDASRGVDVNCDRQFFASAETFYLDPPVPYDARLWFGRDVLAVQAASNGDGSLVAAGQYHLWPRNANSYAAIEMNAGASVAWAAGSGADSTIAIAASVGFVDRAASTPKAVQIVRNTHRACLIIAADLYRKRTGYYKATNAGIAYNAKGFPKDVDEFLEAYVRHVY